MEPKNDLEKRVELAEEKIQNLELSIQNALDTLATGIAKNLEQMWENQTQLSASLNEMSESTAKAIEEIRYAKEPSAGTERQG